eukprot:UN00751
MFYTILLFLVAMLNIATARKSLDILVMGDWGGQSEKPYTTPSQLNTAKIMGKIGKRIGVDQVLGLGDNFYEEGVVNEYDTRFEETFENVFTAKSLKNIPFHFLGGNHDHYGNVSGQIEYSNHSKRWTYPNYWYNLQFKIPGTKHNVDLLMIDTVLLSGQSYSWNYCQSHDIAKEDCLIQPNGPDDLRKAQDQWQWINDTMRESTASYLIVAGHYPIYSIAEHGSTPDLIQNLNPLMEEYKGTAYFSGHDHGFQYIEDNGIGYVDTGGAHCCNNSTAHIDTIPEDSLKFHGCNHGGFTRITFDSNGMYVYYYFGSTTKVQYLTYFSPRN